MASIKWLLLLGTAAAAACARDRYRHAPAGVRHARVCGRHDRVRQRVGHRQQRRRDHVDDPRRQLVGHQRRVPSRRVRRRIRRSGRPGPVHRRTAQPGRDLLYGCGGPERGTELRAHRQLQPARADPRGEPGGPLARRSAVFVRRRARGAELPPRLDDIRDVRLLGPGRRLRLSRRPRRSFPAAGERYRPRGLRRGMVVRAVSGRPVRRLTDRPSRADRAHRSRQRRGANRALVRDDDDQVGPCQLGVRPSRVRATRRDVLPVMVVPTGVRIALRAGPVRLSAAVPTGATGGRRHASEPGRHAARRLGILRRHSSRRPAPAGSPSAWAA